MRQAIKTMAQLRFMRVKLKHAYCHCPSHLGKAQSDDPYSYDNQLVTFIKESLDWAFPTGRPRETRATERVGIKQISRINHSRAKTIAMLDKNCSQMGKYISIGVTQTLPEHLPDRQALTLIKLGVIHWAKNTLF
jgi:hypothetical protein